MVSNILSLWLPTLVATVAIFFLSSIIHMVLPWHHGDYPPLPNEAATLDALRALNIPPGEYMAPRPNGPGDMKTPEFKAKIERGPIILLNVQGPGAASMGKPLILWFVWLLIVIGFAGHIARAILGASPDHMMIFHTIALTSFLGFAAALWQNVIWYRKPAMVVFKSTVDGLIYAVVTAFIFIWLWPE